MNAKLPPLLDHIGWDLWQATQSWKQSFDTEMAARGYAWIGEARGAVFRQIGPSGIAQTALPARLGITKQAVQQLLDELEQGGIITRTPSPKDARKKLITLTDAGIETLRVGNAVKQEIEERYRNALGDAQFEALQKSLRALLELSSPHTTS